MLTSFLSSANCNILGKFWLDRRKHLWGFRDAQPLPSTFESLRSCWSLHPFPTLPSPTRPAVPVTLPLVGRCSKPRVAEARAWVGIGLGRTRRRGGGRSSGARARLVVKAAGDGTRVPALGLGRRAEARGSLSWTLDVLARVGGWAEAVEGRPGHTSRGTYGP
jgi:hypothetical protein